jgi:predicted pyridoxine 5'-phosphate oxidase superfamily flavin-nucleotide-binding protein
MEQPATLTEDMKRVVLEQKLGFAATVCPDGTPNLSPKGTTTVWDDTHLVFADIHSPNTVQNLRRNPAIEINVVDPVVRKGYRFKGRAQLHSHGETYDQGLALLAERGYDARPERIRTIVLIEVEQAAALVSPAYDSGASEQDVADKWARHFTELAEHRSGRSR